MQADDKRKLLARLARAEGQIVALRRMVEDDAYCVDVLTQVAAVRGALAGAGEVVLRNHVETCVAQALQSDDLAARDEKVDELMDVVARFAGRRR